MTVYEIVEARAHDCGKMARMLRGDHTMALAHLGINAHRELRRCFDQSSFRRAWRVDGKLVGLGGITGTTANSSGIVWLAFSKDARKYRRVLLATAKVELAKAMATRRSLATMILTRDEASFRFAKHLGFVISEEMPKHFESVLMTFNAAEAMRN